MRTVVSITPLPLSRDSRTFKQGGTVARCGFESIVLEMGKSEFDVELAFEVRSLLQKNRFSSVPDNRSRDEFTTSHPLSLPSPTRGRGLFGSNSLTHPNSPPANVSRGTPNSRSVREIFVASCRRLLRPVKLLIGPILRRYRFIREWLKYVIPVIRHAPRADLYYLHSFRQFPAVYCLCKRHGASFIYDAHDFYPSVYDEHGFPFKSRFYGFLERLCIKKAAAVVTVSEGVAELQNRRYGCRPIVIRNCHDARFDRRPAACLREQLRLSPKAFLLVAVGRPKVGRATQEAIDAMRLLPDDVHLAFLGNGYEHYPQKLRGIELEKRVHFLRAVKPHEVVPFISDADAAPILYFAASDAYLPSLPNGFFQSVAAGLPLLYPELPEMVRIAEQYNLGIPIDPRSPQSIADAVMILRNDRDELRRYRENATRARSALSWENEETILEDLLHQLLPADGQPRAVSAALVLEE